MTNTVMQAVIFNINTGSVTPIYKQITDQVRMAVAAGKVNVGDPLPSVRALAEQLVVNPNTVARDYTDLTREGLLESRAGRGVFIARKRKIFSREEGWRRLEPLIETVIGEAMILDFTPEELRNAFTEKLSQWKQSTTGEGNHE